ncbi:MAG TPA: transglycosylase SLT domain-containing protein [Modicisalibacter sp.]|nr:transglycosylase SLT domain-containing protein [Modicisalibacter sp.]
MNAYKVNRWVAAWLAAALLTALASDIVHGAARAPDEVPESLVETLAAMASRADLSSQTQQPSAWLEAMQPRLAPFLDDIDTRLKLLQRIRQEARLAGLSPQVVLAVIQVESAFKADAVSSAGALGLMQVMPFWKNVIGRPEDDLLDPGLNLRYGCTILAHYLQRENGDLTRALARYNGSLGKTWYPERVMRAWIDRWWAPSIQGSIE